MTTPQATPEPASGAGAAGPLAGIRVIAVEQAVAAPLCTRHLADLGADVIKIERPDGGDFARGYDTAVRGQSSHFVWLNHGKRSVVLNLKAPHGTAALRRLLRTADVLVSNLAPGAFERIIGDADLDTLNPRLVRCHLSGYGPTGPYAARKAYDALIQAETGTITATGTPDQPAKPGVSLADLAGGTYALTTITAALYARERTGLGQRIDIALFDVLLEWMSPLLLAQLHTGHAPPPAGLHHASIAPYGPVPTADGQVLLIAVQNDGQWRRLCHHLLNPDLATDPRTATNTARLRNRDRIDTALYAITSHLSTRALTARLEAADIPYARLNHLTDVIDHPQAAATGRWSPATLPGGHPATVITSPLLSAAQPERAVPALGAHTVPVLTEVGLAPDQIQDVITETAPPPAPSPSPPVS